MKTNALMHDQRIYKQRQPEDTQIMSSIYISNLHRLVIGLAIIFIFTNLIPEAQKSHVADARLIHIYQRYRPVTNTDDTINSSSSTNIDQINYNSLVEEPVNNFEFSSPMKRIMELLGHHQPVIVVAPTVPSMEENPTSSNQEVVDPHQTSTVEQSLQQSTTRTTAPTQLQISSMQPNDKQHWTLIDSNQVGLQPAGFMIGQQQQLIQSTVPFEPYYLAPNQMVPFSIIQASNQQAPQAYQQSHSNPPQMTSLDERTQPVFLSSYVPEINMPMRLANEYSLMPQTSGNQQQQLQPNSIQQIQQQQKQQHIQTEPEVEKSPEQKSNENSSKDDDRDERSSSEEDGSSKATNINDSNDDNEDKAKDDHKNHDDSKEESSGEEPAGSGGSSTYEDKYDSDKDEPRSIKKVYTAEPSNVVYGLTNVGLNDDCLQCICRASSGCDHLLRCITRGSEERFCGPFQLTEDYWTKAGSPGDNANNFISFEDCANDADCAVEAVTNYMRKFLKDCDNDSKITCMDYARLHRLKPDECDNTEKLITDFDAYWAKFQRCAEGYNKSRSGDDEDI